MYCGEKEAKSTVSENSSVSSPVCRLISANCSREGAVVSFTKTAAGDPLTAMTMKSDISRTADSGKDKKQSRAAS